MSVGDQQGRGTDDGTVRAAVEAIAVAARQVPSWAWDRGFLIARDVGSGFDIDLAFRLPDGSTVRPVVPYAVSSKLDELQRQLRARESHAFILRCEMTPERVESFTIDTESDPWPHGWADPDALTRIGLAAPNRPRWMVDGLTALNPADGSRRATRAALWTVEVQHLLVELGTQWEPRGTGNSLVLVRSRSPWLLDVIACDSGRGPSRGGRLLVFVIDLLDGVDHVTIGRGIAKHVLSFEGPSARRLIAQVVFGPGMRLLESVQPYSEAAIALSQARRSDWAEWHNVLYQAGKQVSAAAWELAVAPSTAQPRAAQAPQDVHEVAATDDGFFAEELSKVGQDAQAMAAIARLGTADRLAAMHERRDAKLRALKLDPTNRRSLKTVRADSHSVQPLVSWANLLDGLTETVATMPRNAVVSLWEWQPGGAAARLSRRHDDGRLELELRADRHMRTARRGGAARTDHLRALGWLDPESSGRGLPSWFWPGEDDDRALCERAVETLRSVYGISRPEQLGVEAVWGSSGTQLRTPALPLLSWPLMPYVTQQGAAEETSAARNGSYAITTAAEYELTTVQGQRYAVVDDASALDHLTTLAPSGALIQPLSPEAPTVHVDITTTATFTSTGAPAGTVIRRDGKYLELLDNASGQRRWHHDENVTVVETVTELSQPWVT